MAEEPDGIDETFEGLLRIGLTVAGRVAEIVLRAREQAAREARAASEQEARELGSRLAAERSAARAQLALVERSDWWERAQPAEVAAAWETACAWAPLDQDAARAVERIRHEVRDRYGIDVDAPAGDPSAVRAALERRGLLEQQAATQHRVSGLDHAEAARLLAEADRADRADQARPYLDRQAQDHAREERMAGVVREVWPAAAAETVVNGAAFGAVAYHLERLENAGRDPRDVLAGISAEDVTKPDIQQPAAFLAWRLDGRASQAERQAERIGNRPPPDAPAPAAQAPADAGPGAQRGAGTERGAALAAASQNTYDTAERRRDLAASLEGVADGEAVQARVVADTFQAQPVTAAVAQAPGARPGGRKGPAAAPRRVKQRTETLER